MSKNVNLRLLTSDEFARYLEQVMYDLEESGKMATAQDYAEMIRRIGHAQFVSGRAVDLLSEITGD